MDYLVTGKIIIDVELEVSAQNEKEAMKMAKDQYVEFHKLQYTTSIDGIEYDLSVGEIID